MNALIEFLKDKSLLSAVLILLLSESLMQFGCYQPFLKKSSYAQSVNKITDSALASLPALKPNILIIGTSIAYEGISTKQLNEKLAGSGFIAQSIAIPGSELMVQELALRKILKANPAIQYILHVNELQLPWVDRRSLITSTLAMITELDRIDALEKLREDHYKLDVMDYLTLFSRWVAYRSDIADMLLRPDKRWKEFLRGRKIDSKNVYAYENSYLPSLSHFKFQNIKDCLKETQKGASIPSGSDRHHMSAIYKTCTLVSETKLTLEPNEHTELFKLRLKNFYTYIGAKNLKIINVYPPVSTYLDPKDNEKRREFWEREYADLLQNQRFDLSNAIPQEHNSDYYYDLIHLNAKGMELFTNSLAKSILTLKRP